MYVFSLFDGLRSILVVGGDFFVVFRFLFTRCITSSYEKRVRVLEIIHACQ